MTVKEGISQMKATGIVRRIDDLGRVVIPKEIRRTLRIREGDPLEIFTDRGGEVILKKYSPMVDLSYFAQEYADSLAESTGHIAVIADQDEIVAVGGAPKRAFKNKRLTEACEKMMKEGRTFIFNNPNENPAIENVEFNSQVVSPIMRNGDVEGVIILIAKEGQMGDVEIKLADTAAGFLAKQLD
jgi:AbrB family transcriptional regulator (stage V sporulation protein T)